jgi:hypothetical protein
MKLSYTMVSICSEPDTNTSKHLVCKKRQLKNSMLNSSGISASDYLNLI